MPTKSEAATKRIYLDYNATTPLDPTVAEIIVTNLTGAWGNPSSLYPEGVKAKNVIATAREQTAKGIRAVASDIVFTSGGTEANNWVVLSTIEHFKQRSQAESKLKPHIISTTIEHDAISLPLSHFREKGEIDVTFVPVNKERGFVTPEDVVNAIRPNTCLVTVIMANNETGAIMPIAEISKLVKERNSSVLIHTDAAQAIGKIPVDVGLLGVDYLTIVGHKIYGPRIGALFIKGLLQNGGASLYKIFHGGGQERNLRPGTENTALIAGLGKAVEMASDGVKEFAAAMKMTRDHLEKRLKDDFQDAVVFNCASSCRLPNTCSVAFIGKNREGYNLVKKICGFSCSTGSACHANECKPSQILLEFNIPFEIAANTLRLSTGRETTVADIDKVVDELKHLLLP